ncbi:diacylglycerol kinase [Thalassotalea sp. Y01]|uniref:diacylglycerol kinase n=1 Tax=Thalassotalea sp. Y01 TaxID=2729613 RepID=UPI00145C75D7|nr:diacylglycerol kinase [Thalassotalea sp. Y01]NMP15633.1 diacylglycerol kinase [Thalassotalea sp. Y01]
MTNKPNGTGLGRIIKAGYCSIKGFRAAWQHEAAFRQEALLCLLLFPISIVIASDFQQWLWMFFSMIFVLFAELVNSALEALADKVCLEHDPLIGRAKDIGSAIVFVALVFMSVVFFITLYQYLGELLR